MKMLLMLIATSISFSAGATPSKYCQAAKKTSKNIDQLRIVELPYKLVESKVVEALVKDKCVRSRLSNEEVYTLSQMLLDFNNNQDTAAQIIGEFLAQ